MHMRSPWLGVFITYLFLGFSQVLAIGIDESLICRICNGYQICGRKQSQTPECLDGIPCTMEQYHLCGKMADSIINRKCDHPGIFPDPKCPSKYYTCESNKNTSSFDKRMWTCPAHKTFDPVTKHCLSNNEKRMLQVVQNNDRCNTTADDTKFVCQDVGIFPDPNDCKVYHSCNKKLESQDFYCSDGTYFDGVNCNKTKQCLSQLEKNYQNQLKEGEEIYIRIKKLLVNNGSTELENSFQGTAETKYTHFADCDNPTPESGNQARRSIWNLQKIFRGKLCKPHKLSERIILGLKKLQDTIPTIAEKIKKKAKLMKDYMREKICNKIKKLADEISLKEKLSLCNITYDTVVQCNCHQYDNSINHNWTNLSTYYTTPVPVTSRQTTHSLQRNVTALQSYINTTTEQKLTVTPNVETVTSKSYIETTKCSTTETEDTHGSSNNSIKQEQTSNYHETDQTTSPNHKTTTSVFHNEYDENKTKYEEITSVKHETITTRPQNSTKTLNSTVWVGIQEENIAGNVYNETDSGQTVPLKQITAAAVYTEHSTVDDETEGETLNHKTTSITGNYINTTPQVDVFTNNEDEPHFTKELETIFHSKNKITTKEIDTTIQVHVTTAGSDMEYSSDIQSAHYGGTTSTIINHLNTTGYTETTPETDVNTNDETHVQQTLSSEQSETTEESDSKYPSVNEDTHNGNITTAKYTTTTVEQYSESTFYPHVFSTDKDEYSESNTYVEKNSTTHEPKSTESRSEGTLHIDVHTNDKDVGQETLEEQTSLDQKTTTEHSSVNEETNDVKTTAPLEDKLTTTEFNYETTFHVDTHTNSEIINPPERKTTSDFENKSTTGFYGEEASDVQGFDTKATFGPPTGGFHSETTLHFHSDEDNEGIPPASTVTGFNNEPMSHTDIYSNDGDEYTELFETTTTTKHKTTKHPSNFDETVKEITNLPTRGTESEPKAGANSSAYTRTTFDREVAFIPAQRSTTAQPNSETTFPVDVHDEYGTDDQNSADEEYDTDYQNNTPDEYDSDNKHDIDDMNHTGMGYDYIDTYDLKKTSSFNSKNIATQFRRESMSHSKNYRDAEKRYETPGREISTKYVSAAYDESTPHMGVHSSNKYNNTLEGITTTQPKHKTTAKISDNGHSLHGLVIQDGETTSIPKPTVSGTYSRTTNDDSTSGNGKITLPTNTKTPESYSRITSAPNSIKNESPTLNSETTTPKNSTTNHSYETTTSDSTSAFPVTPNGVTAKIVTTEMTLSTSLMQTVITTKPPHPFRCLRAGYFEDPKDCHSYYHCSAVFINTKPCHGCSNTGRWKLVGTHHTCRNGRWFSKVFYKCVKFRPLLC